MRAFQYARPESVADAVALLGDNSPGARPLAGGTDLLVGVRNGKLKTDLVVDLKWVADLPTGIEEFSGALRVGPTVALTYVIEDERIRQHFPALVEAARTVGSVAIRNRATLAGNICNASPAADTAPPLLVYGAEVDLQGRSGTRRVRLDEFFLGPGETELQPGEILTAVWLPIPTRPVGAAFGRVTRRRGVDLATINLCCLVDANGVTTFAYGAVGPRPFLVRDDRGVLASRDTAEEEREAVLQDMISHASPISDVRASAEYRRAMLRVMSRRTLARAADRLGAA